MSSERKWDVRVERAIGKTLRKFPRGDAEAVTEAILRMSDDPYAGDIQKLAGQDIWRRRVGSYRIYFEVYQDRRLVVVFKVERRTSTTY